ncbi:ferric chelate reductase 1 like, partial [Homo sapiens]
ARGDTGADEAVPRHDSSYGTFAGEFYDLRYLSEEDMANQAVMQRPVTISSATG